MGAQRGEIKKHAGRVGVIGGLVEADAEIVSGIHVERIALGGDGAGVDGFIDGSGGNQQRGQGAGISAGLRYAAIERHAGLEVQLFAKAGGQSFDKSEVFSGGGRRGGQGDARGLWTELGERDFAVRGPALEGQAGRAGRASRAERSGRLGRAAGLRAGGRHAVGHRLTPLLEPLLLLRGGGTSGPELVHYGLDVRRDLWRRLRVAGNGKQSREDDGSRDEMREDSSTGRKHDRSFPC